MSKLEIEWRLTSTVSATSPYNFTLHNLDYARVEDTSEYAKKGEYRIFEQGFIDLPTQVEAEDVTIDFERAVSGEHVKFKTKILHKTWEAEDVATQMFNRLVSIDEESKDAEDPKDRTNYAKKFPLEKCEQIVRESMKRAKNRTGRITDENRQKFLQALGTLRRKAAKRVVYKLSPKALVCINTSERQVESCGAAEIRRGSKTVFYASGSKSTLLDDQIEFFHEVEDEDGDYEKGHVPITNDSNFKTPANLIIADMKPERRFVRELCNHENAVKLDAWLKNTPKPIFND